LAKNLNEGKYESKRNGQEKDTGQNKTKIYMLKVLSSENYQVLKISSEDRYSFGDGVLGICILKNF
jgi:hypothetical protein